MAKILIERPDGTKITIEGEKAEEIARQLSPPPVQFTPVRYPAYPVPTLPYSVGGTWWLRPCTWCGRYGCLETHVICTTQTVSSGTLQVSGKAS